MISKWRCPTCQRWVSEPMGKRCEACGREVRAAEAAPVPVTVQDALPGGNAWQFNDGGRGEAGYAGAAGDCAARALAIALPVPYREACALITTYAAKERPGARRGRRGRPAKRSHYRTGVYASTLQRILADQGWTWTPLMTIGSGTRVHLKGDELPSGRLIARLSKHYVAVLDGVVQDTYDPSRDGTRAVYGYWRR